MSFYITSDLMRARLQCLGSRFGLRTPLIVWLEGEQQPIYRLGYCYFTMSGGFLPDDKPEVTGGDIIVFARAYPKDFFIEEKEIGVSLLGKKRLARIIGHEVKHQIDFQNRFWRWVGSLFPLPKSVDQVPELIRYQRWLGRLTFFVVYTLDPLEIRARWHSFWHWRQYYQACWQSSYFTDQRLAALGLKTTEDMTQVLTTITSYKLVNP